MSINLNPIGYQSKTKNGNEYQKSNICKTVGLVTAVGVGIALRKKQNRAYGGYWADEAIVEIAKAFNKEIKFSDKTKNIIRNVDLITDILGIFGIGYLVDNYINKKRAEKADKHV